MLAIVLCILLIISDIFADRSHGGVSKISIATRSGYPTFSGTTVGRRSRKGHQRQAEMDSGGCFVSESEGPDSGWARSGHIGGGAFQLASSDQYCRAWRFIKPDATCDARSKFHADSMQVSSHKQVQWCINDTKEDL